MQCKILQIWVIHSSVAAQLWPGSLHATVALLLLEPRRQLRLFSSCIDGFGGDNVSVIAISEDSNPHAIVDALN